MADNITVAQLPIGAVLANPNQPRKSFSGIEDLASSIAANGLLQPITVRPIGPERYEIVAGERRFRAMTHLQWTEVPAIIRPVADEDVFELSMLENVARQQMNPIEEAAGLQQLLDGGMSHTEIERRLGIGNGDGGEVKWKVKLLGAIEPVQHLVGRGQFSQTQAIQLARLTPDGQMRAVRELNERGLSGNAFTALVETIFMQESQREMFAETKLDPETKAKADKFRTAIDRLAKDAELIAGIDPDVLGSAFSHDLPRLEGQIDTAMKALTRARRGVQRQVGREQAVLA